MLLAIDGSVISAITSGVVYSAAGALILVMIREAISSGTESQRTKLVGIWLLVLMSAALTALLISARQKYSMNRRVAPGVSFAVVCITACIGTCRQRRARGKFPDSSKEGL